MEKIKVAVVDDHPLVRQGLRRLLEMEHDLEIVGEAGSAAEAYELVSEKSPDVVVLDLNLPGHNGIQVTRELKSLKIRIGVVILTVHDDSGTLAAALKAGADAFCPKGDDPAIVVEAIRRAAVGQKSLPPSGTASPRPERPSSLTIREAEILAMIAQGLSNRQIGERLFISEKTVRNHLSHIFEKIGVQDRTQAALYSIQSGLADRPKNGTFVP